MRFQLSPRNRSNTEGDWRAIKIVGPLAFELTGVMSSFLVPLADAGISVFTISTFSTDYIFVREQSLDGALNALKRAEIRPVGLT